MIRLFAPMIPVALAVIALNAAVLAFLLTRYIRENRSTS